MMSVKAGEAQVAKYDCDTRQGDFLLPSTEPAVRKQELIPIITVCSEDQQGDDVHLP